MATHKLIRSSLPQSEQPRFEVVTITPADATRILSENPEPFRNPAQGRVKQYAEEMAAEGKWLLAGDPICFDRSGKLIDGRHRLCALELAKVSIDFVVAYNVDPMALWVKDTGQPRSAAQIIKSFRPGMPCPNIVVAAARWLVNYDEADRNDISLKAGYARRKNVSVQYLDQVIDENPGLAVSAYATRAFKNEEIKTLPWSIAAFAHFKASEANAPKADAFFKALGEGTAEKPHANWKLGRWCQLIRQDPAVHMNRYEACTVTIRAWIAYERGRDGVNLKYDPAQPIERFRCAEVAAKAKGA